MSILQTRQYLQNTSTLNDTDSPKSGWPHSVQEPLDEITSTLQQQKPPFAGRDLIDNIADVFVPRYRGTAKAHPVEPPKRQGWPEPYATPVQNLKMQIWVIEAMTKPLQRKDGANWFGAVNLASDQKMLPDRLLELFRSASDEMFEDGMDSYFSNGLNRIILTHGIAAVGALEAMIYADGVNQEVAAEALSRMA